MKLSTCNVHTQQILKLERDREEQYVQWTRMTRTFEKRSNFVESHACITAGHWISWHLQLETFEESVFAFFIDALLSVPLLSQHSSRIAATYSDHHIYDLKIKYTQWYMLHQQLTAANRVQTVILCRYGRVNTCRRLLDSAHGPYLMNDTDGDGLTALHIAAQSGHSKIIKLLLERGAAIST